MVQYTKPVPYVSGTVLYGYFLESDVKSVNPLISIFTPETSFEHSRIPRTVPTPPTPYCMFLQQSDSTAFDVPESISPGSTEDSILRSFMLNHVSLAQMPELAKDF